MCLLVILEDGTNVAYLLIVRTRTNKYDLNKICSILNPRSSLLLSSSDITNDETVFFILFTFQT